MEIQEYINKKKNLQNKILEFLDDENNKEENYQNLMNEFRNQKIGEDFQELKIFLHLLNKLSSNHNRSENFFVKFEILFNIFKKVIMKHFSSYQIFRIFKNNKRFLLFLFNEKIIIPDKHIVTMITKNKYKKFNYYNYFYPEIKAFKNEAFKQNQEYFEENRKIGENEGHLCELIRNDMIDEFISYVNHKNLSLNAVIERSIYETNMILNKKQPSLIEYSAFFGSIQIFKYLHMNGAELSSSIWVYSIHGRHPEMIHYLEENKIKCPIESLKESVKCHHNEIVNYLLTNVFKNASIFHLCIKYYNYQIMPESIDLNSEKIFYDLCKYDYVYLVSVLLKNSSLNINQKFMNDSINNCSTEITTPLKIAAIKENVEIIKLLVSDDRISIEESTFYCCLSLTQITIPPSVKSIYKDSFYGCSSLTQVILPSTLKLIGERAFKGCSSLKEIFISNQNELTNDCSINENHLLDQFTKPFERSINDNAFKGCSSLVEISISSLATSIGKSSFDGCSSLVTISVSSKVASFGENAFNGCSSLKKISTSFTITSIEENAFEECSSLEQISILSNSSKIDENTEEMKVVIPASIKSIGKNAFEGCFSMTQVTIPSSVRTIGSFAFHGCLSLKSISVPSSIIDLGDSAFYCCTSLARIMIPSYINEIKTFTFRDCSSLTHVTIPSFVTTIGYSAFYGCTSLKKVIIPNSVTEICYCAFAMCTSLKNIVIPFSVTSIGGSAFEGCSSLVKLTIPTSVIAIGENAFKDCSALEQIDLPFIFDSVLPLGILPNVNVIRV